MKQKTTKVFFKGITNHSDTSCDCVGRIDKFYHLSVTEVIDNETRQITRILEDLPIKIADDILTNKNWKGNYHELHSEIRNKIREFVLQECFEEYK